MPAGLYGRGNAERNGGKAAEHGVAMHRTVRPELQRPRVGERIMLEVLPTGEAYPGEVQSVTDPAVIVVAPIARHATRPPVGSAVRVTFVRKDGLYEDQGAVTDLTDGPEPQLSVQLAGQVLRTQRRDYVRQDASLNAEVIVRGTTLKCVTKDVSGGGVSLLVSTIPPMTEGDEFEISLNVPDGRPAIRATCQTKYVREILRGSRWMVGSQFIAIDEDDRQRLVRFVFRLELAQKRSR